MTVTAWPATVNVPVRAALLFFATDTPTVAEPVPAALRVIVIHETSLVAVQEQPAVVLTPTRKSPPPASTDTLVGDTTYSHGGGGGSPAAWVMTKAWPAIARVVDRAGPVFASTTNLTEPSPLPWRPPVTVTQEAELVALQAQPLLVATETLPLPPLAPKSWLDGEVEYVQVLVGGGGGPGAAAWMTTTGCPATDTVVERAAPLLAAAVNETEPLPLPELPEAIVSHGAETSAVQAQLA